MRRSFWVVSSLMTGGCTMGTSACLLYTSAAWMKKPVQRAGAAYKKAAGALSAATLDRAQNAVTYRIYGCEDARAERYEEALDTYEKAAVKNNVWQSALPPLYLAAVSYTHLMLAR